MTAHKSELDSALAIDTYVNGVAKQFGHIYSLQQEFTAEVPIEGDLGLVGEPHTMRATVEVPIRLSPITALPQKQGPRYLTIELFGPKMPYSELPKLPTLQYRTETPDSKDGEAELLIARGIYAYNTRHELAAWQTVTDYGLSAGITKADQEKGVLMHLALVTNQRFTRTQTAAKYITDLAYEHGTSRVVQKGCIPIVDIIRFVGETAGKPAPVSLQHAKDIFFTGFRTLIADESEPSIAQSKLTIDQHNGGKRVITDYHTTTYKNADPEPNGDYYAVIGSSGTEGVPITQTTTMGVRQDVRTGSDTEKKFATTAAEARDMLGMLYKNVTVLRGYLTRNNDALTA